MIYALVSLPFLAVTLVVTLISAVRSAFARRMAASGAAAVVLIALTAVFDNAMIAAGLFHYPPQHLSGLHIGLAPLEDFAYPLSAAFLVPAVLVLLGGRRDTTPEILASGRPKSPRTAPATADPPENRPSERDS